MPGADADAHLIEGVQRGDADAWREVIGRYQGRLLTFARRMLAQPAEAEDIVQETFLGLLRSVGSYDQTRSLETYLFSILRHKLSDHFRRAPRGQRQSLDQLDIEGGTIDSEESPSQYMAGQEAIAAQRGVLVDCLRQWVEQCQEQGRFQELMVIEMLVVLGLRNKEVASDLSMSETAVAGVKFRVLERWRALTQAASPGREWNEADFAQNSDVARVWREEGVSCIKRSTLGRYLLGAVEDDWASYIEFHVESAACDRCNANLEDLRAEDARDEADRARFREKCFASSVGFLSRRPQE